MLPAALFYHAVVFLIGNPIQPNHHAILGIGTDGDMRKPAIGRCAVPMHQIGRYGNHIAFVQYPNRFAFFLVIAGAFGTKQYLPTGVGMPVIARARLKYYVANYAVKRGIVGYQNFHPCLAGKVVCRGAITLRENGI